MPNPAVQIPCEGVAEFCRRNHVRRFSLFGSVLREDLGPESDVDVLVPGGGAGARGGAGEVFAELERRIAEPGRGD